MFDVLISGVLIFGCLIFAINAADNQKGTPQESDEKLADEEECQIIPKQEASRTAQTKTGGKVIDIKLDSKGKDSTYRIRVLVGEERVKHITLDACR
jgi:uncharacterized membrane protein YkoI